MRIAFAYDLVYPFSKGGVEKRIWDLSRLLAARGHEVVVVGMRYWDGDDDLVCDGVRFHGICAPTQIHRGDGRRSISQAVRFAFHLGRYVSRHRFDVIDVQGMSPLSCLVTLLVSRFTTDSVVVTWYEVWRGYWHQYLGFLGYGGQLVEWLVARLGRVHAATSRLTSERLIDWGVGPVHWMPIGIDYRWIESVRPDRDSVADVIYVGRLAEHKNINLLIDALAVLRLRSIEPSVLIVGEGPERAGLESRVMGAGLSNVRFLGRVESDTDVVSMLKAARVFAFPSVREGFGLAPLEAMAAGLPVVAVAHEQNAATELIESGVTGVLTADDPADFARGLGELLTDPALRDRMSERARTQAEEHDWPLVVDIAERVYLDSLRPGRDVTSNSRQQRAAR